MAKRLPFHIQHNTTPVYLQKVLSLVTEGDCTVEKLSSSQRLAKDTAGKILRFLRQIGVLDGWRLSEFGERLRQLGQTHPDLLAEAVHVHLYTLHWTQPDAYFSFAYATICDWLWERGEWKLDGRSVSQLVSVVVDAAEQLYKVDASQIAFSTNSVRGALNWLRALNPPVLTRSGGEIFKQRPTCPVQTLLWAVDALYHHPDWQRNYGVRMQLDDERLTLLSKICMTTLDGLEKVLEMAGRVHDYRRPEGFFGIGTEGGFGRWLILTKPFPAGNP